MQNEEFRKLLRAYPSKAIQFLYARYYRALVRIALRHVEDEKVAEDIVQEVLVHVWEDHKRLGEYHKRPIQYYLVQVVKYKAVSEFRKSVQNKESHLGYVRENVEGRSDPPVEANIMRNELIDEIRRVIGTFPEREKECLTMKLDFEMNAGQIAFALSLTRKAVERSLTSGNKRLRQFWRGK
jgi:RNA polymerase sigma factor (sigma-70 family)